MNEKLLNMYYRFKCRGGLAIVAMCHYSQWPFQSPIQKVKKGPFGGIFGAFWKNLYGMYV
jgi:hypothetical protein